MYPSVEEFFQAEQPELGLYLNNPGGFWPIVKDNSITNADLDRTVATYEAAGSFNSAVYRASLALMRARLTGKLPNPG